MSRRRMMTGIGIDKHTSLLLHGDDFVDASPYKHQIINKGAIIATGKFDKGIQLGTNRYIQIPDGFVNVDMSLDWTIDWWENVTSNKFIPESASILSNRIALPLSNQQGMGIFLGYTGNSLYAGNSGAWNIFIGEKIKDTNVGTWVHWAFIKHGNQYTSYKNGKMFWSKASSAVITKLEGDACTIGASVSDDKIYPGYHAIVSEFRISNIARWTSDFTPSIKPY